MFLFIVPNMTCGGCAKSVVKALQGVDVDAKIETDPPKREVRIQTSADESALREILSEAGYPAEDKAAA
ncbi:heavy metal transport/detoxification protein [Rhizobium sp. Root73]|uniref:heavy-metal-associated domain-containing protein n=1 Tax=unclassified Rhizobium TaxID=2613769 RepID=UPI000724D2A6|nr:MULTISPECIES: heavy-metal-associated domain-containing protein [unclassified Rhizobium]KQY13097.1 heavy metal transport/detoxification protein [Rhizobium sp. Root1334]KRC12556.1 heavy metal transport/detoxification protein [Rhizobium sp. Root73]